MIYYVAYLKNGDKLPHDITQNDLQIISKVCLLSSGILYIYYIKYILLIKYIYYLTVCG